LAQKIVSLENALITSEDKVKELESKIRSYENYEFMKKKIDGILSFFFFLSEKMTQKL